MVVSTMQQILEQYGLYSYVLPWIVMFAIFFGLLETINIFKKRNINLVLAIVLSLFATYSNVGTPVAAFMIKLFQSTGIVLSGLFVLLLLVGTLSLGMRKGDEEGIFGIFENHKTSILVFGLLVALIIFINSGGMMFLGNEKDAGNVVTVAVWVIIILLALSWLLGGRKEKTGAEKLADLVKELEKKKQ